MESVLLKLMYSVSSVRTLVTYKPFSPFSLSQNISFHHPIFVSNYLPLISLLSTNRLAVFQILLANCFYTETHWSTYVDITPFPIAVFTPCHQQHQRSGFEKFLVRKSDTSIAKKKTGLFTAMTKNIRTFSNVTPCNRIEECISRRHIKSKIEGEKKMNVSA